MRVLHHWFYPLFCYCYIRQSRKRISNMDWISAFSYVKILLLCHTFYFVCTNNYQLYCLKSCFQGGMWMSHYQYIRSSYFINFTLLFCDNFTVDITIIYTLMPCCFVYDRFHFLPSGSLLFQFAAVSSRKSYIFLICDIVWKRVLAM